MNPELYREMSQHEDRHWWYVVRREILDATIGSLSLSEDAEILEIGAGTGGNLQMLKRHGHVHAIEMNDYARQHASTRCEIQVEEGSLPDSIPYQPSTFDLICLFDVLEHIEKDIDSLTFVRTLLKPQGRIVLTVPAYQWLWSSHDVLHHHKRRYTLSRVVDTAAKAELEVDRASYFNTFLFPVVVVIRVFDRLRGKHESSGMVMPGPVTNFILASIFRAESFLLRAVNMPFGVSILAVLSKRGSL
jgi:SAM-dependent methyltransferase